MSGGSLNYCFSHINQAIESIEVNTDLRRAFIAHLKLVSDALYAIEWADSGDTEPGQFDVPAMMAVLGDRIHVEAPY